MERLLPKARSAGAGAQASAHAARAGDVREEVATRHESKARVDRALD
jgi:hypothetical protein